MDCHLIVHCKPYGCQLVENRPELQLTNFISSAMNLNFRHKYITENNKNTHSLNEIISVHHGKLISE